MDPWPGSGRVSSEARFEAEGVVEGGADRENGTGPSPSVEGKSECEMNQCGLAAR